MRLWAVFFFFRHLLRFGLRWRSRWIKLGAQINHQAVFFARFSTGYAAILGEVKELGKLLEAIAFPIEVWRLFADPLFEGSDGRAVVFQVEPVHFQDVANHRQRVFGAR